MYKGFKYQFLEVQLMFSQLNFEKVHINIGYALISHVN